MPEEIQEIEIEQEEQEEVSTEGLSPEEMEMAQSHGIVKKDQTEETETEKTATEEVETEEAVAEKKEEEEPSFEEMDETLNKRPDDFHKNFDKNAKALYFKQKKYKQRAQEAEAEKELLQMKLKELQQKVDTIDQSGEKKDDDDIFTDEPEGEKPVTMSELKKLASEEQKREQEKQQTISRQAKRIKETLDLQEAEARTKYEDFDQVMVLAKDVITKGLIPKDLPLTAEELQQKYTQKMINMEEDLADFAYRIGKLHPNYGKEVEEKKEESVAPKNKDIEKMLKNAEKPSSSANIGGGAGGKRKVSVEDITIEEAAKLTTQQWRALPEKVRQRLLAS